MNRHDRRDAPAGTELTRDRLLVFSVAFGARVVLAAGVSIWLARTGRSHLFPDELIYLGEARDMTEGAPFNLHGYSNGLSLLFEVAGASAWMPRWINVVLGACLALATHQFALLVFRRQKVALWSGLAVGLWPSLITWSVFVLKDPAAELAFLVALTTGIAAMVRRSWRPAVGCFLALLALGQLRRYGFVLAQWTLLVGSAAVLVSRARVWTAGAVAAACLVASVLGGFGVFSSGFISTYLQPDEIERTRQGSARGATSFAGGADEGEISSLADVLDDLPRALFFATLGPFPSSPGDAAARGLLLVEFPLWIAALALAAVGLFRTVRTGRAPPVAIGVAIAVVAGTLGIVALYQRNAGTALRQRGMVVPIVVVFAAYGVETLVTRRRSDQSERDEGVLAAQSSS